MYSTQYNDTFFLHLTTVNERTNVWVRLDTVTGFEEFFSSPGHFDHTSVWIDREEILVEQTGEEILKRMKELVEGEGK